MLSWFQKDHHAWKLETYDYVWEIDNVQYSVLGISQIDLEV